mmetsp:Transcript_38649/g.89795  ORF Transcript_38649/g.89795 Transcript_38649/m.89795 type:complete len:336 (-) Transcript_38649:467-1474(-)
MHPGPQLGIMLRHVHMVVLLLKLQKLLEAFQPGQPRRPFRSRRLLDDLPDHPEIVQPLDLLLAQRGGHLPQLDLFVLVPHARHPFGQPVVDPPRPRHLAVSVHLFERRELLVPFVEGGGLVILEDDAHVVEPHDPGGGQDGVGVLTQLLELLALGDEPGAHGGLVFIEFFSLLELEVAVFLEVGLDLAAHGVPFFELFLHLFLLAGGVFFGEGFFGGVVLFAFAGELEADVLEAFDPGGGHGGGFVVYEFAVVGTLRLGPAPEQLVLGAAGKAVSVALDVVSEAFEEQLPLVLLFGGGEGVFVPLLAFFCRSRSPVPRGAGPGGRRAWICRRSGI